ncbi:MAG: transcriptional regulator [Kiritimatiellae bacterium]|nr:transcriptional regulator [Kiritimatiellia bacterium]
MFPIPKHTNRDRKRSSAKQALFLICLRDIAHAQGISQVAQDSKLNREHLYRILSESGNPQRASLNALLHSLGLKITIEAESVAA